MPTSSSGTPARPSRQHAAAWRVVVAGVASLLLVGGAGYAATRPAGPGGPEASGTSAPVRDGNALRAEQEAFAAGQQVLGGEREPGTPAVQRLEHDRVLFTVSVAPARPGPNLVRVDTLPLDAKAHRQHRGLPVQVGTSEQDLVEATPRPGTDGLWAVVDLPEGTGTVLVTHGPRHRVPFPVETGRDDGAGQDARALWTGPDGPECLAAASAAFLAGADGAGTTTTCPAAELSEADRSSLVSVVDTLAARGVEEVAVAADGSARSQEALQAVQQAATAAGVAVVDPAQRPGTRNALLVVSGWAEAATSLADTWALPPTEQPIRNDGTWLAPWLLTPQVVDSTPGVVLALDFDIRDPGAREFSNTLATYLPGQSPTASAYAAWRAVGDDASAPGSTTLYAASRAAVMPSTGGGHAHETEVAWFPGGTVTPIGAPAG